MLGFNFMVEYFFFVFKMVTKNLLDVIHSEMALNICNHEKLCYYCLGTSLISSFPYISTAVFRYCMWEPCFCLFPLQSSLSRVAAIFIFLFQCILYCNKESMFTFCLLRNIYGIKN